MPRRILLAVPHHAQHNDYTCGLQSLHMLFDFYGVPWRERETARIAGTTKENGTSPDGLMRALKHAGLKAKRTARASWPDLHNTIQSGIPALVHYQEPGSNASHYAVAVGLDKRNIILNDPANGQHFRLPIRAFKRRWIGYLNRYKEFGWMIVVEGRRVD